MKKTNNFRVLAAVAAAAILALAMASCGDGDPVDSPKDKDLAGTIEFRTYADYKNEFGMIGVPITADYNGTDVESVSVEWFYNEHSLSKGKTYTPDLDQLDALNFDPGEDYITAVVSAAGYKEKELDVLIKEAPGYSLFFGKWESKAEETGSGTDKWGQARVYTEWAEIWPDYFLLTDDGDPANAAAGDYDAGDPGFIGFRITGWTGTDAPANIVGNFPQAYRVAVALDTDRGQFGYNFAATSLGASPAYNMYVNGTKDIYLRTRYPNSPAGALSGGASGTNSNAEPAAYHYKKIAGSTPD